MRYAVLSDIHANYHALQAVEADVKHLLQNGSPPAYWFLGDLVGYGPSPVNCIRWLRYSANIGDRWVPGNHDEWLINETEVHPDARFTLCHHRDLLASEYPEHDGWFREEVRRAIEKEARSLVVEENPGLTLTFVHGTVPPSLRRTTYLYPWKRHELRAAFNELVQYVSRREERVVLFTGHTHYPMWAFLDQGEVRLRSLAYNRPLKLDLGLTIINSGSVGQPRDGDIRPSYVLLNTDEITVEFRRPNYDVETTLKQMKQEKYPTTLQQRLARADRDSDKYQLYRTVYRPPRWSLETVQEQDCSPLEEEL
jgi:diadenosine tetraphosphatase ApaH/serine/threonine PP2A family protein phosphatase